MASPTLTYSHQALSVTDIVIRLKGKGLAFADETEAVKWLKVISYFRFASYLRPFEVAGTDHVFKPLASFEKAKLLYDFDARLRMLCFDAIQRVEVAVRAKMIQYLSMAHGAFWFMDMGLCESQLLYLKNMSSVQREVERARKEDFIKEHFAKYAWPEFPPAWKTLELSSFGTLSKLYANCNDNGVKKRIARELNLPQHEVLESWLVAIGNLRNACAHHSRVWNRVFPMTPKVDLSLRGDWITDVSMPVNKVYAILCCVQYLLDAVDDANVLKQELKALLGMYPMVDVAAMGFSENWDEEPLWKTDIADDSEEASEDGAIVSSDGNTSDEPASGVSEAVSEEAEAAVEKSGSDEVDTASDEVKD